MSHAAASGSPPRRGRWRLPLALAAALPLLYWGGLWLHHRLTHVQTQDAQVVAAMITLSPRGAGWVTELDLLQGDRVRAGEVLAVLDGRDAALRLEALEARLAALGAERDELDARIELVASQGESRYARAQARQAALEAAGAAAAARQRQAEREQRRLEPMATAGLVPEQGLDQAGDALEAAVEARRQAEAELQTALAELAEARAGLLEPELLRQRRQVLEARLRELDAERRRLELEIDDHQIRSPIDGIVDKVFVDRGEYVGAGQGLLMLHDPQAVWVEARIKETQLAPVRQGQPVRIRVDAFPDRRYSGRVERIAGAATSQFALLPSPNPSGNFTKVTQRIPVRIAFDEPDPRLAPGMMVEVSIDVRR